jgi:hypothetical protein
MGVCTVLAGGGLGGGWMGVLVVTILSFFFILTCADDQRSHAYKRDNYKRIRKHDLKLFLFDFSSMWKKQKHTGKTFLTSTFYEYFCLIVNYTNCEE